MNRFCFLMIMMLLQIRCFAVTVETTENLNVYYPEYSRIDLVCGQMPWGQVLWGQAPSCMKCLEYSVFLSFFA